MDNKLQLPQDTKIILKDEKYYWTHQLDLMKNPTLIFNSMKKIALVAIIPALIDLVYGFVKGNGLSSLIAALFIYLAFIAILFPLTTFLLPIIGRNQNWHYNVLYVMDDHSINQYQLNKLLTDTQLDDKLSLLAGKEKENAECVHMSSYVVRFQQITQVKAEKESNLINADSQLVKNQVYVNSTDFDFVYNYIVTHCTKRY